MRLLARACAFVFALVAFLATGAEALAHAALVASEPADGSVLASPPRAFTLTFNEPVTALVFRLVAGGGSTTLANPSGRAATLVVEAPEMPRGTHVLSWRVVSLDGHPVSGAIVFSIGAPSAGPIPDIENTVAPAVAALLWAAKVALYLGLFVGIGGAFFAAWIASHGTASARGAITAALALGMVAAPLSVGLQGLDALGLPVAGLGQKIAWTAGLETSYGLTAIAAAFRCSQPSFPWKPRFGLGVPSSLVGLLGVGVALALSGHAGAAEPQWLMRPAVFAHAASLAFWIGALLPLAAVLRRDDAAALDALARFSRAIPVAIVALVVSGAALALVQVEAPAALFSTAYGRLLSAKLALVTGLLSIAAWNRFRVTPAITGGDLAQRRRLVRMITAELVLVVAIFGIVAAWRFTPPPRAVEIAARRPATLHIHTDKAMADLSLEPGRAGPVRISILLLNGEFGGLDAKELGLTFRNEPAGIEPIARAARRDASGYWRVENLVLPVPGRWSVVVDILVNDFEKIVLDGTIDVRP